MAGLGRRSQAPMPLLHDPANQHVHRPKPLPDLRQVKMIRAGLIKWDPASSSWVEVENITAAQMTAAMNAPSPAEPPRIAIDLRSSSPVHAADAAAALATAESSKLG